MREFNEPPFLPDYPAHGHVHHGQHGPVPKYLPRPQTVQRWPNHDDGLWPQKPWYASKTIIFNVAMGVLGAIEISAHLIQPLMDSNVYAIGLFTVTIGNALLRAVTYQGIR